MVESLELRQMLSASPVITGAANPTAVTLGTTAPTLNDSATLTGSNAATGTITFTLTDPSNNVVDTETATVNGDGTYSTPTGYTLPTTGSVLGGYQWNVSYDGDINNDPASDFNDPAELVTVNGPYPTLAGPGGTVATLGTTAPTLIGSATLSGGYFETGPIIFNLIGPGNTTLDTETVAANGNATYTTPVGYTLPTNSTVAGTYVWDVVYIGDANNFSATHSNAADETTLFNPANPTITGTLVSNTVTLGSSTTTLTDSAVLAGGYAPTGIVTFTLTDPNNVVVDTETAVVSDNGTYSTPFGYTLPTTGTVTGAYQWAVSYNGDGNNNSASDNNDPNQVVTVNVASPALVGPGATTVTLGTTSPTLADSVVLSGGYYETGLINFYLLNSSNVVVDSESVTVSGDGTYTTPTGFTLPTTGTVTGGYQWNVFYAGDTNNNGYGEVYDPNQVVTVNAASPTISLTPPTATVNLGTTAPTLTASAVLSGGYYETGTIYFGLYDLATSSFIDIESVSANGNNTYTTPTGFTLPTSGAVAGQYQWGASYVGDGNNNPYGGTALDDQQVTVNAASPTVAGTPSSTTVNLGTTAPLLTDSVILSGGYYETGTVTFTLIDPFNNVVDTETATVSGNSTYSTPNGYTLPTTGTVTGVYQWNVSYGGDLNNNVASDNNDFNEQVTVNPANPTIVGTPVGGTTVTLGASTGPLTDSAVLAGGFNETGTITFTLTGPSNTTIDTETVTVSGNGTYSTPAGYTLPTIGSVVGTYQWNVSYSGDTNNNAASDTSDINEKVTVIPATPTITGPGPITITLGTSTQTLVGSAVLNNGFHETGSLTFTLIGPANTTLDTETLTVSGNGTYTTPIGYTLPTSGSVTGAYQWNVVYAGDTNNNPVLDINDSTEHVNVNKANPTFTVTANAPVVLNTGALMTASAVLANGYFPTGTVYFTLYDPSFTAVLQESGTANGDGTYATPTGYLPTVAGTYTWIATYSGDANNNTTYTTTPDYSVGPGITAIGSTLYFVGGATNDDLNVTPIGHSQTGSTGIQVTGDLNGTYFPPTNYNQSFTNFFVVGFGGNDHFQFAKTLTINTTVSDGNGNDTIQLGNGTNTVTLGTGYDSVTAGDGTNTVTAGAPGSHGDIQVTLGNGNYDSVALQGNGNDSVQVGNGSSDAVQIIGNGNDSVQVGQYFNYLLGGPANGTGDVVQIVGNGNETVTTYGDSGKVYLYGTGNLHLTPGWTSMGVSAPTVTYGTSSTVTVTMGSGSGTPTGNVSLSINGGAAILGTLNGSGQVAFNLGNLNAGVYTVSVNYAAQGGFPAMSETGTLTVNQRAVTLTGSRIYDSTNVAVAGILTISNLVGGDNLTLVGGAILASPNAGTEPITSFANLSLGGTSVNNYTLVGAKGSVAINAVALTFTGSRTYNGSNIVSTDILTVTNLVGGDKVSLYGGTIQLASPNAGPEAITSFGFLSLQGPSASNYTLVGATGTVTINALAVTLTGHRIYDGTNTAAGSILNAANLISGDNLTLTGSATLASPNVGNEPITSFAGLTLGGTSAGNYTLVGASGSVKITSHALAVVLFGSMVYNGTNTAPASSLTVIDLATGDNLTLTGSVTLAGKNAGTQAITSFAGLTLGGTSAGDYTLVGASGWVTITPRAVTLTGSRAYNGTNTAAANILSVTDLIAGDNLTLAGSATLASKNVGTETITSAAGLTLGGTSANNYTVVGANGSVTIHALALTLTVSGSTTYSGTTTVSASGLTITGTNPIIGDNLTLSGTVTLAGKNVGVEAITSFVGLALSGTSAGNYTIAGVSGSVTVKALAVTLTGTRTYNGTTAAAANILTVTDLVAGDNLTLTGSAILASKNVGTEAITSFTGLTLGGTSFKNYTLVGASGSVTITRLSLTLMLSGSTTYNGINTAPASSLTIAGSNAIAGDNLTLSGNVTFASKNVGIEAITSVAGLTLSGTSAGNYTLVGATGSVTVKALAVTLTGSRTYNGTSTAAANLLSVTNLVAGDNLTLSGSVTLAGKNVGTEAITSTLGLTLGGTSASNYTVVKATGSVTITKLAVTLTGSRTYNGTNTATASILTVSDLASGDSLTLTGSSVTLASKNVGAEAITSFAGLTLGGLSAGNYTLVGATGAVTIKALAVTLTGSRTYNGTNSAAAGILTVSDLVAGDNLTLSGSATLASKNVGTEAITSASGLTLGGTSAGNYTLVGATGSVTIKALAVTLTGSRSYDGTSTAVAGVLTVSDLAVGDSLTLTGSVTLAGKNAGTEAITSFGRPEIDRSFGS